MLGGWGIGTDLFLEPQDDESDGEEDLASMLAKLQHDKVRREAPTDDH